MNDVEDLEKMHAPDFALACIYSSTFGIVRLAGTASASPSKEAARE